jgi:hypothetical protein
VHRVEGGTKFECTELSGGQNLSTHSWGGTKFECTELRGGQN